MTDYSSAISQINGANSLDAIKAIVNQYSAKAVGPGAILYTGNVGSTSAHDIALSIVEKSEAAGLTVNILDTTSRAALHPRWTGRQRDK